MHKALAIATLTVVAGISPSRAEEGRMDRLEFRRAVECLAYANMDALQASRPNLGDLDSRFAAELASRPLPTRGEVKNAMRSFRANAGRVSTPQDVERATALRDRACQHFVEAPLARN